MECLNNIAVCCLVTKDYNKVLETTKEVNLRLKKVLLLNSNNFNAMSYRIKALICLNRDLEAYSLIKQALAIKYSKTLINYLSEIDVKLNQEKAEKARILKEGLTSITSSSITESDKDQSEKRDKNTHVSRSIFNSTFFKLLKLIFFSLKDFIKRHKFFVLIVVTIWMYTSRHKLKVTIIDIVRFLKIF